MCGRTPEEGDSEREEGETFLGDVDWNSSPQISVVWAPRIGAVVAAGDGSVDGAHGAEVVYEAQHEADHDEDDHQGLESSLDCDHHQKAYFHQD